MREAFQEELEKFLDKLIMLSNFANESLHKAIKAFDENDNELAHEVIADDLRINALSVEIERDAYRLIALQQPVTGDLRKIFTVFSANSDVERIADHATSVAKTVIRRNPDEEKIERLDDIVKQMGELAQGMITDVIQAFVNGDVRAARKIADRDNELDVLQQQIYGIAAKTMEFDTEVIVGGINYIGVANNLERIGDYVTNICERIVYLHSGDIVELN
ncbi:phosphate signaling complex protein PhoU [Aerococcaceae bacterium INB8]|uniref:Phosphate-specific transport system accessory protein PhoU n=1 Tax=Ruoffia halotolerans TaxID=2748684 RepID=A0A839A786_9LACT|nr:phosphate signaling complex protein PhoU [Ruoffia halotolerans]MBA5729533.1 phosphate signaling complex protein PhoU [Ruoffia halotolerans]